MERVPLRWAVEHKPQRQHKMRFQSASKLKPMQQIPYRWVEAPWRAHNMRPLSGSVPRPMHNTPWRQALLPSLVEVHLPPSDTTPMRRLPMRSPWGHAPQPTVRRWQTLLQWLIPLLRPTKCIHLALHLQQRLQGLSKARWAQYPWAMPPAPAKSSMWLLVQKTPMP